MLRKKKKQNKDTCYVNFEFFFFFLIFSLSFVVFIIKASINSWQLFEEERETVRRFINNTSNELHKELLFNNLDRLKTELERHKVCVCVCVIMF